MLPSPPAKKMRSQVKWPLIDLLATVYLTLFLQLFKSGSPEYSHLNYVDCTVSFLQGHHCSLPSD